MLGRPREARDQLVQALNLAHETGDRKTQMLALRTLADVHAQAPPRGRRGHADVGDA